MNLDQAQQVAQEKNQQERARHSKVRYVTVTDPPGEPCYAKNYLVVSRQVA
jgi:hypothetical protein